MGNALGMDSGRPRLIVREWTAKNDEKKLSAMSSRKSSCIRSVGYESGRLSITFHSGNTYTYNGVPESLYIGLITASSPGEYYNLNIRGRY